MSNLAGVPTRKCLAMIIPSMPGVYETQSKFCRVETDTCPGKMGCGAYDGIRTICTEQRAWRATASETLPRKKRPNPVCP
jgi:hypothetical protein